MILHPVSFLNPLSQCSIQAPNAAPGVRASIRPPTPRDDTFDHNSAALQPYCASGGTADLDTSLHALDAASNELSVTCFQIRSQHEWMSLDALDEFQRFLCRHSRPVARDAG